MKPPRSPATGSSPPENSGRAGLRPAAQGALRDPLQLGVTIVGTTAVFGGIGWWLDSLLGSFPVLMALGAMAGLFGIIYVTYLRLREADRAAQRDRQDESLTGRDSE